MGMLLILTITQRCIAQQSANLLPNGSFEQYDHLRSNAHSFFDLSVVFPFCSSPYQGRRFDGFVSDAARIVFQQTKEKDYGSFRFPEPAHGKVMLAMRTVFYQTPKEPAPFHFYSQHFVLETRQPLKPGIIYRLRFKAQRKWIKDDRWNEGLTQLGVSLLEKIPPPASKANVIVQFIPDFVPIATEDISTDQWTECQTLFRPTAPVSQLLITDFFNPYSSLDPASLPEYDCFTMFDDFRLEAVNPLDFPFSALSGGNPFLWHQAFFQQGKDSIADTDGAEALSQKLQLLKPGISEGIRLTLKGFASTEGGEKANHRLATQRAQWIADQLTALGFPPEKVMIETVGEVVGQPEENRKVEIWIGK